jgi:gluconate 5-dehydrogenase
MEVRMVRTVRMVRGVRARRNSVAGSRGRRSMASVLDQFRLDGTRALVTGASRGLGREMALAFADAGADVAITGRTDGTLARTAADIRARGRQAWTCRADMAVPAECEAACRRVLDEAGPIDILVNNVGNREVSVPIATEPLETWQRSIDLNLTSCFLATRTLGQAMLDRGRGGRIINIASISALIANRGIGGRDYETSKAAVLHFTRCAAVDWAPHGITVNAICPGLFMTDINREWNAKRPDVIDAFVQNVPMGRPGEPHEIGPLAVFLASPASAYVTGAAFVIDGGYTAW